jgi:hypothetical protein
MNCKAFIQYSVKLCFLWLSSVSRISANYLKLRCIPCKVLITDDIYFNIKWLRAEYLQFRAKVSISVYQILLTVN